MKIRRLHILNIKIVDSLDEAFSFIEECFDNDEVLIPFIKIKRSKKLKNDVLAIIKRILFLEESLNKESTMLVDKDCKHIVHDMHEALCPKKMVIGIALGGGGARGALQMGQLKAMEEYGILDDYDCMAGTSIGAINLVSYVSNGLEYTTKFWNDKQQDIIFKRRRLKEAFSNLGLFDRSATKKYLREFIDESKFNVSYPDYYINTYSMRMKDIHALHLNHRSKETIVEDCLSSSAIPLIYGISKREDDTYIDPGLFDNQSIKCLIKKGCNVIITASLSVYPKCISYAKEGLCIIDLGSVNFYKFFLSGSFSFDKGVEEKIEHGYKVSVKLFDKLNDLGVLDIIKSRDIKQFYKLEQYYNLSKKENNYKIRKPFF